MHMGVCVCITEDWTYDICDELHPHFFLKFLFIYSFIFILKQGLITMPRLD